MFDKKHIEDLCSRIESLEAKLDRIDVALRNAGLIKTGHKIPPGVYSRSALASCFETYADNVVDRVNALYEALGMTFETIPSTPEKKVAIKIKKGK